MERRWRGSVMYGPPSSAKPPLAPQVSDMKSLTAVEMTLGTFYE
jgi:hypothetical protein